jgi:hypothetical protein
MVSVLSTGERIAGLLEVISTRAFSTRPSDSELREGCSGRPRVLVLILPGAIPHVFVR